MNIQAACSNAIPGTSVEPVLVAISMAVYINSLHGEFCFDDTFAVINNKDVVQSNSSLTALWTHDFWGQNISKSDSHKSYRPLTVLSLRLSRAIDGHLPPRPFGFHVLNVILHGLVTWLFLRLALELYSRKQNAARSTTERRAVLAALLFALHPVHTEAVSGIVGRAELLCAVFVLIGLLNYIQAVRDRAKQHAFLLGSALVCAVIAVLCKEVGLTMLGAFLTYDFIDFALLYLNPSSQSGERAAVSPGTRVRAKGGGVRMVSSGVKRSSSAARRRALRVVCSIALGVGYVVFRKRLLVQSLVDIFRKVENPIPFMPTVLLRWLNVAKLHTWYGSMLLFPYYLSADWSFACVPTVGSLFEWVNGLSATFYLIVLLFFFPILLNPRSPDWWLQGFCVLGLVIGPFIPASNIFLYVGTYIAERLLYLPSMGFSLVLADWLQTLFERDVPSDWARRRAPIPAGRIQKCIGHGLVVAFLLAYSVRTSMRNRAWSSEADLFMSALEVCPQSAKVQLNCGILNRRYQNWDQAQAHFQTAVDVEPGYCDPTYWQGLTYLNAGDQANGVAYLERAVECIYTRAQAVSSLNMIYHMLHQSQPTSGEHLEAWARILVRVDEWEDACTYFHEASALYSAQGNNSAAHVAREQCMQLGVAPKQATQACSLLQSYALQDDEAATKYIRGPDAVRCRL
ncbi:hypothetical protein CYMTET_5321 [Cymbomonas tetramitiformis]|uniref:dolichyl-phosphate-mannose--protein mannosyltransferase n=1 Tax=Cymbomonas tetramitiformis TaxID=36881 RepID=A0AAE0GZE1_9CHLO|nr:hypothetical protein CYMTET_5321 [Cymbomonas tetramitiformis]